jgi:tripeptidyl-peptidase-1
MTLFRPDAVGSQISIVNVNGSTNDENQPTLEARILLSMSVYVSKHVITQGNLDVQYAGSMSFPTPNIYYITGGSPAFIPDYFTSTNTNEPYLDWLKFILHQPTIPQTISTSYGDDEQTVPRDYATTVCNMFAQLGAMGSSVLFASGDFGVGAGSCLSNDGTRKKHRRFIPMFPASCESFISPFIQLVLWMLGFTRGL